MERKTREEEMREGKRGERVEQEEKNALRGERGRGAGRIDERRGGVRK